MRQLCLILLVSAALCGCKDSATQPPEPAPANIVMSIVASSTSFWPGEFIELTVTAENKGTATVEFGYGGSCVLGVRAFLGGKETSLGVGRICTTEYSLRSLKPGAIRQETMYTEGSIHNPGPVGTIEPGVYVVHGAVGEFSSEPIEIEFFNEPVSP